MQYTITVEVYVNKTENQVCILLHLQMGQFRKSFTMHLVSLNRWDLLLTVLVYMQQQ